MENILIILYYYVKDQLKKAQLCWFGPVSYTHLDVYKRQKEG